MNALKPPDVVDINISASGKTVKKNVMNSNYGQLLK